MVVEACKECQLVKWIKNIRFNVDDLKNISTCDLFYKVALDITKPFLEIENGNKYILVAINHYFKWCEAKVVLDHTATTTIKFLEEKIVCKYRVPKFIHIDMVVNDDQLNLIIYARCMGFTIITLHPSGYGAMLCLKGWLKPLKHIITLMSTFHKNLST